MCPKQTVGLVNVIVTEDHDVSGYRIKMVTDDREEVCNHIICKGYKLTKKCEEKRNHSCSWTALDFATDDPVMKTFNVTFSSSVSLELFCQLFNEGLKLAEDQDLTVSRHAYNLGQESGSADGL
ncbi:hypothetical protein HELRODRAFT_160279 [Helobdella robusta]|uniref:RanBD1 domain-containing protein n=1 Tax=Helobdella robusta TaxID=6412 RepID=T1EQ15_HELRO|nr:hypothetical protein HELRODRAFT_160279 [Helobdella robusta]ESO06133.1 hypothetical protein HELRODRAFT_160279 [Helobdella robusta]